MLNFPSFFLVSVVNIKPLGKGGYIYIYTTQCWKKILNRNTMKISYRCGPNITSVIGAHSRAIMKEEGTDIPAEYPGVTRSNKPKRRDVDKRCNSFNFDCPVGGECLTKNVVYGTKVCEIDKDGSMIGGWREYVGQTVPEWKGRWAN